MFTQEYGEKIADIFGRVNEVVPYLTRSHGSDADINMDLWNNAVGRSYGNNTVEREKLFELLKQALENGELIVTPSDSRRYEGAAVLDIDACPRVVVLKESKTGRNELFFDLLKKEGMTCQQFIDGIKSGSYPEFQISVIGGEETPVSRKDGSIDNNLG